MALRQRMKLSGGTPESPTYNLSKEGFYAVYRRFTKVGNDCWYEPIEAKDLEQAKGLASRLIEEERKKLEKEKIGSIIIVGIYTNRSEAAHEAAERNRY